MSTAQSILQEIDQAVAEHWQRLESALEYGGGTHSVEDVWQSIRAGTMQIWPADNSVVVTEIVTYPQKRVLHIFLAAGVLAELRDMEPSVEQFARLNGCDGVTIAGRAGWARALADLGYRETLRHLHKEVAPEGAGG